MERVLGIGGFFFRAKDPYVLARWYEENLGICVYPATDEWWMQQGGPTVLAPFDEDTEHFGRADQQAMVNFRVGDLDAMLAQLRVGGAIVSDEIRGSRVRSLRLGHRSGGQPIRAVAALARSPGSRLILLPSP